MRELEEAAEKSIHTAEEALIAIAQEIQESYGSDIESDNEAFFAAVEELLSSNTNSKLTIH